jgi:hypothetical protein
LNLTNLAERVVQRVLAWPLHTKLLMSLAVSVLVVELLFRRFAPRSAAYHRWTSIFEAIGRVWTVVLLSVIYWLSVGPVSLVTRLLGRDLLDVAQRPQGSFWQRHEPNPLGLRASARHQF